MALLISLVPSIVARDDHQTVTTLPVPTPIAYITCQVANVSWRRSALLLSFDAHVNISVNRRARAYNR